MFWRLFLTFLALVVCSVGLVGLVILRSSSPDLFVELAGEVLLAGTAIVVLSVAPAYLLARRFTRPLTDLTRGADRLAVGDFTQHIHVTGSREFVTLARTFNGMTDRLADAFRTSEHDRQQLRTILSGMVEGVVAIDESQRVLFANDTAGTMLGFDPEPAVGRVLWEVTRLRALREAVEAALAGGGPQRREVSLNGGSERYLTLYVSLLPGAAPSGAVLVMQDTSDVRRLERLRQDFVANVSHELKTPLANIKSSVETLIDGAVEDPGARGMFLGEIADQADRQQVLIEDLLSLARIETAELRMAPERVLVDDAVHTCLDRHRTRAEAKGLTLNGVAMADTPPDLAVWVDEEGLAQVLDNLVDNAIKYTPAGRITARWRATADEVVIEVEDTGMGIPLADQPRIFERFYRVNKDRSREMGGTGLGLAIVKHMVQALKGAVTVESELGVGSKFTVSLPRFGAECGNGVCKMPPTPSTNGRHG
jgi:two-component system, OmpR family, phosphate regulon sensor histidine kinase PhoR